MGKKNFDDIPAARINDVLDEAMAHDTQEKPQARKERRTYTARETADFQNEMKTQGRKNVKLKRVNLSVTNGNYDFVTTMARVRGESVTHFINHVLDDYRTKNADLYMQALEFKNRL